VCADSVVESAAVGPGQVSRGDRATDAEPAVVAKQRRQPTDVIPQGDVAGVDEQSVVDDDAAAAASPARRRASQRVTVVRLARRVARHVAVGRQPSRDTSPSVVNRRDRSP